MQTCAKDDHPLLLSMGKSNFNTILQVIKIYVKILTHHVLRGGAFGRQLRHKSGNLIKDISALVTET